MLERKYFPIMGIFILLLFTYQKNNNAVGRSVLQKIDTNYVFKNTDSIISIEKVHNHCNIRKAFHLSKRTEVKISTCGEIFIGKENGKRDVFEMYFNLNNEKSIVYNSKFNKFFFFSEADGSSPGVNVAFHTVNRNTYNIEIIIPRRLLGEQKVLGFDFALTDNDNGFEQEKQIAWHSTDSDIWLNPSLWGTLALANNKNTHQDNSTITSLFAAVSPIPDGIEDNCWKSIPISRATNVLYGTVKNTSSNTDISGELKSMWDDHFLYFWIKVTDDKIVKKSYMRKVFDHGWIEDVNGNLIWEMSVANSKYAGGARKNFRADTTILIKSGNYFLCYKSDESHAYNQWDNDPPNSPLYGIRLQLK